MAFERIGLASMDGPLTSTEPPESAGCLSKGGGAPEEVDGLSLLPTGIVEKKVK